MTPDVAGSGGRSGRAILDFSVSSSGNPIPAAKICITCKNDPNHHPFTRATTDTSGQARVEVDAGRHEVEIRSPGLIPFYEDLEVATHEERIIQASLFPGGSLRGVARGPGGHSLAKEWITVLRTGEGSSERVEFAITSEDGQWEVDNLPPGKYHVEISCPGYTAHVPVEIEVGSRLNLETSLGQGPALQGSLIGEESEPVPGILIFLHGVTTRREARVRTDQLGRFWIAGLCDESQDYTTCGSEKGFADNFGELDPATSPIAPIRLERGGKVVGRVIAETFPEQCKIMLFAESESGSGSYFVASASRERPAFELDGIPSGRYRAQVLAPGYSQVDAMAPLSVENKQTTECVIRLIPEGKR